MRIAQTIMNIALFILCMYIAFQSDIATISAIWGFSAGIWCTLSIKSLVELYYGYKYHV